MKGEINRDYYCSAMLYKGACFPRNNLQMEYECDSRCPNHHRKWPTPEQFKDEYGEEVPQGMPVWVSFDIAGVNATTWVLTQIATEFLSADRTVYYGQNHIKKVNTIVVACTPWGKPPTGWRPE